MGAWLTLETRPSPCVTLKGHVKVQLILEDLHNYPRLTFDAERPNLAQKHAMVSHVSHSKRPS